MANVTRTTVWSDNQVLNAAALNGEFNNLLNNVQIVNADISSVAAIDYSKLNLALSIVNADISASANIDGTKIATTLANKTLTSPSISNATITTATITTGTVGVKTSTQTLVTATDGATVTFDLSLGNVQTVTLGGSRILAVSNASVGQAFVLRLVQDGSGSKTVTWFSTIKWAYGVVPTLTTTANKTDVFGFICTSAGNFDGYVISQSL